MAAVVQVEVNLWNYNYKRGGINCFGAIVAVDLAWKRLTE